MDYVLILGFRFDKKTPKKNRTKSKVDIFDNVDKNSSIECNSEKSENARKKKMIVRSNCNLCGLFHLRKRDCLKVEKPFQCHQCAKSFVKKRELERHLIVHSNDKPFICTTCDGRFRRSWELVKHDKIVHQGIKYELHKHYKCTYCLKSFASQKKLDDHQHVHTGVKNYTCDICGSQLSSKRNLLAHKRAMHEPSGSKHKKCICHICGSSYNIHSYSKHLRNIHGNGKPECHLCGKKLSSKSMLQVHLNQHSGNKPYCCEICGENFVSSDQLKKHLRNHSKETSYSCHICQSNFDQKSCLKQHINTAHPELKS